MKEEWIKPSNYRIMNYDSNHFPTTVTLCRPKFYLLRILKAPTIGLRLLLRAIYVIMYMIVIYMKNMLLFKPFIGEALYYKKNPKFYYLTYIHLISLIYFVIKLSKLIYYLFLRPECVISSSNTLTFSL